MANERVTRCPCPECHGKIHRQLACRTRARAEPDDPARDLTGRYEEDQQYPQFTVQVNQAGRHVEGWLQIAHVTPKGQAVPALPRERYTFAGDLPDRHASAIDIDIVDDWTRYRGSRVGQGRLSSTGGGLSISAGVRYPGTGHGFTVDSRLRRYPVGATVPRLSADALAALPPRVRQEVEPFETGPIPTPYLRELREWFSPDVVRTLILTSRGYENTMSTSQAGLARRQLIRDFHRYVGMFLSRFHPDLMPVLRWHVRGHLSQHTLTPESSRSLLLDLEVVVTRTPQSDGEFPLFGDDGLRLIRTDYGDREHRYSGELFLSPTSKPLTPRTILGRAPIGVGGVQGTLTVRKVSPTDRNWPGPVTYNVELWGGWFGGKAGLKTAIRKTGTAVTYADWRPENLSGTAFLIDASLWIGLGVGFSAGGTTLRVHGDATWAALDFGFPPLGIVGAVGAGIAGSLYYGRLTRPGAPRPAAPAAKPTNFPITGSGSAQAHFALGCALLEPAGRQAVRRLCAQELFFLQSPASTLRIDGYTDRVDCARRNRELSRLRAQNVEQAVRDTLGGKLPRELDIALEPYGEKPADEAGLRNGAEDWSWRKVEVFLNGRAMMQLRDPR